jgi:very-short-patch-repair endonuclease
MATDPRTPRARTLRRNMTEPERKLWRDLNSLPVAASHWRRQAPIGPFVADFVCQAARLVIEVDGAQHGFDAERRRDDARTHYLEAAGYRVLRFWNHEVLRERPVVMDTIYAALAEKGIVER